MGGETEAHVSAWTVDNLKEHVEALLAARDARLDERQQANQAAIEQVRRETERALANADKAVLKSEAAAERRFEAVNEFRGQLTDQASKFLTKETYEVAHEALDGKVDIIQNLITGIVAEKRGAGDRTTAIYALAGFVSVLLVIGTVLAANGVFR